MNDTFTLSASTIVMVSILSMAGCTTAGKTPGFAQNGEDTVEICETRGTHTQCFRQSASAYAEQVESYRERLEMRDQID